MEISNHKIGAIVYKYVDKNGFNNLIVKVDFVGVDYTKKNSQLTWPTNCPSSSVIRKMYADKII